MSTLVRHIDADPDVVFGMITDLNGLPRWNRAITRVLDEPDSLVPGSEWVVEVTAFGRRWPSRSRLELLDTATRTFRYRSGTDDGNPSYASWQWTVAAVPEGSDVTVTWRVAPQTFWRRILLSRIRGQQLARSEVPASLSALDARATSGTRDVPQGG